MKTAATTALALALAAASAPLTAPAALGDARASKPLLEQQRLQREQERVQRMQDYRRREFRRVDTDRIAWGNEHRPNRTVVLTLDEPLEKTTGTDVVEVELFSTGLDDDGTADITSCAMRLALAEWWPTLEEAGLPVHLAYRQVDEGPGLDEAHLGSRRDFAELIVGGSIHAREGDERGERLVTKAMRRPGAVVETMLSEVGIAPGEWEENTRDEVERTRAVDNARWVEFAGQYVRWRGRDPSGRRALGQGAAPIVLVDGRYLVTMNTIRRQGGLKAPEKLFQTVNAIMRDRIENLKTPMTEEPTMNNMAATVMAVAMALGTCAGAKGAQDEREARKQWLSNTGWRVEVGTAEVLENAAQLRLGSGRVVQVMFLEPLEGDEARRAHEFVSGIIQGRKVECGWHHKASEAGDPRAITPEGLVIASCKVREKPYARCMDPTCGINYRAITNGYGKLARGPWETRSVGAGKSVRRLEGVQEEARRAGRGVWGSN